tara:strand:+ start:769 stop:936 length:168 start_codon:yes stop_codon:yes gene_type:complete
MRQKNMFDVELIINQSANRSISKTNTAINELSDTGLPRHIDVEFKRTAVFEHGTL